MGKLFDLDTPVMQWLQKIAYVIFCGFFWFLLCIPVITAGAATTAMYRLMFNIREEKTSSVKEYFRVFAKEFGKSTLLWLLELLCIAVLGLFFAYMYYCVEVGTLLYILAAVFILLLFACLFTFTFVYPLTAYFKNTVLKTVRNGFRMAIGHRRQSLKIVALSILPLACCILTAQISLEMFFYFIIYILPIWLFVIIPLLFYRQSFHFLEIFENYIKETEDSSISTH